MRDRSSTRRSYDRLSRIYDVFSGGERRLGERGLALLAPQAGERVLELGPGTGHALAAIGRTGAMAFGLDLSRGMLGRAREAAPLARLMEGDATRLPIPDGTFDAVFLAFTLELFPEGEIPTVLAECRRVLTGPGRLGVVALRSVERPGPMGRLYGWSHRTFPSVVDCRPIAVEELVAAAGFAITRREELSMWGLPVLAVAAR